MLHRFVLLAAGAALLGHVALAQSEMQALADHARAKIDGIVETGEATRGSGRESVRTVLTEAEINAYLRVHGPGLLPSGITGTQFRLGSERRVKGRAIVDLDAVRRSRPRSWLDPLAYLHGAVEVIALGKITAEAGVGRAQLESATVGGVAVPRVVLEELLKFYTSTPERPAGIELDKPFELPAGIRSAEIEPARVTIVQ
jgi:hypothetical protein